ncbi:SCO family protein [Virgibacillus sp. MSJ-26]|uniref:SCO family protein n=1 Tax=Virgibacillus sp. MSJ-26 TaxID=2841522 RepID=UPI001C0FD9F6|nr:SCO family protein [Virgibacillus sp. MSJ-26]MBU5468379.1 SCO family protein [Virgibacillus sp. MSJ-26]HLR64456.1 SCO family protein [Pseudogracilibacillus sp.]
MDAKWRKRVAITMVLVFGSLLVYFGTDGLTAFTVETARLNELIEEQPTFPDVTLEDSEERVYSFSEFDDKYVLITFIYTSCTTVCLDLEMNMAQVYNKVPEEFIGEDISFLSISFDPTVDDPETLDKYKGYFDSDGETWRMARIPDQQELDNLLDEFGVIVIPDGYGDYAHNAAFYLVDSNGKLVNVMDYQDTDGAADEITRILESNRGNQS